MRAALLRAVSERKSEDKLVLTTVLLTELLASASLAAFRTADLRRPWATIAPCSDVSESFGYGLHFGHLRRRDVFEPTGNVAAPRGVCSHRAV